MKRKSPLQLQALEAFYSEQKYPTPEEMKAYGKSLGLTFKEVRGWFAERRRDRKKEGRIRPSAKKRPTSVGNNGLGASAAEKSNNRRNSQLFNRLNMNNPTSSKCNYGGFQELLTPQYILTKIFRKDGPPLGVEFDSLPSRTRKASWLGSSSADKGKHREAKKRKISELMNHDNRDFMEENATVTKHGMGKGLMTVWRAVNPKGSNFPPGIDLSQSLSRKPRPQKKKQSQIATILKQKMLQKRSREKKKRSMNREVELNKDETQITHKEKCELALCGEVFEENQDKFAMLVDDEELEMRELQAGANPLTCLDHLPGSGLDGCFLCKDLLSKFPPKSVKMKLPFGMHPWDSSQESVKKLFKVFHFVYTYSVTLDVCPFTLDEFAQAFHDKDSLLLGKVHLSLLKLLLLDVETELQRGTFPNLSISCKFLALLHSVERQILILDLWKESLNPLTWSEILRQILVAAGFGSNKCVIRTEELSKEMKLMTKYGLRLGTLKGELFRLLYEQGNSGLKVSDLINSAQVAGLNLESASEDLEQSIRSTLASDITVFEKISEATYRLRANCFYEDPEKSQSDSEDSGSVDDEPGDDCSSSSGYDSECVSESFALSKVRHRSSGKRKTKLLDVYTEIDESHPGEPWLLGLMEGEYSDLSIEEKLDILVALVDLLSSGSTVRMEDPLKATGDGAPSIYNHGSGGKIKRSSSTQHSYPRASWVHGGQVHSSKDASKSSDSCPVDSSSVVGTFAKQTGDQADVHPMQSVYLGSDRRFNRYWLFLGPCTAYDPGHRSVYFESSEDGHWEVINNKEALRSLLLVLDDRGLREARLIDSLEKRETFLCKAMSSRQPTRSDVVREESSSPVSDIDNNLSLTEITNDHSSSPHGAIVFEVGNKSEQNLRRIHLREFDAWVWADFYSNLNAVKHSRRSYLDSLARCEICHDLYWRDEKHCKICHTTFELDIDLEERYAVHTATCRKKAENSTLPDHKVLSSQLQSLKAAVHAIEAAMPVEALIGAWKNSAHRLWVKRLRRTSSLSELLQVIGNFVGAINEGWLWQSDGDGHSNAVMEEIITCFPTMPQTSSAVALWLVKLDALIAPYMEKAHPEKNKERRTKNASTRVSKL